MPLELEVSKLIEEIDLMKSIYFKGFNDCSVSIRNGCEYYLRNPKDIVREDVLRNVSTIEDFYTVIPFEKMENNVYFAPIFVTRDLLKDYFSFVRRFLENPTKDSYESIHTICSAIGRVVNLFDRNFNNALMNLRKYPGYERFSVDVFDKRGTSWKFPVL